MSKKFVIFLFAVLLCLCLVFSACGKNSDTDNTDGNGGNTEQSGETDDGLEESEEITEMYITVNGNKLKVTLAENSTVNALVELLKNGDITYTAHANNFEIYGDIGHNLSTTNDTQMTSQAGDVFLWAGDNICIFFGNNSYSYTRIGRIEGYSASQLKAILAPTSNVSVILGLK